MASRSHREGPRFEPGRNLTFCKPVTQVIRDKFSFCHDEELSNRLVTKVDRYMSNIAYSIIVELFNLKFQILSILLACIGLKPADGVDEMLPVSVESANELVNMGGSFACCESIRLRVLIHGPR